MDEIIENKVNDQKIKLEESRSILKMIELLPVGQETEISTLAEITKNNEAHVVSAIKYLLSNNPGLGNYSNETNTFKRGSNIENYMKKAIALIEKEEKVLEAGKEY